MKGKKRSVREKLRGAYNQIVGELFAGIIVAVMLAGLACVGFLVLPSFIAENLDPEVLVLIGIAVILLLLSIIGGIAKIFKKRKEPSAEENGASSACKTEEEGNI